MVCVYEFVPMREDELVCVNFYQYEQVNLCHEFVCVAMQSSVFRCERLRGT